MRKLQIEDAEVMRIAIQQEIERSEESRYDHRLHGLLLVTTGQSCREVAALFGENGTTVQRWVNRFRRAAWTRCVKESGRGDPARWTRRIGASCNRTCARRRATSIWRPPCGTGRCCRSICVGAMEWASVCGNASGCFETWAFGYVSPAPKSPHRIR